jgi:hypothetical protein
LNPSSPPGLSRNNATPDGRRLSIAFDKKQDITTFSSGYGGYSPAATGGAAAGARRCANEILVGTLVIDVADAAEIGRVARHGRQKVGVPGESREARREHQRGGEEGLKDFPPTKSSGDGCADGLSYRNDHGRAEPTSDRSRLLRVRDAMP